MFKDREQNRAFTLLEILLSLGILSGMMMAISTMLRSNFDIRESISAEGKITHRLNVVIQKVVKDLTHTFVLSKKNTYRYPTTRNIATIFQIEPSGEGSKIKFTSFANESIRANSKESDIALIVYETKADEKNPDRTNLYRGSASFFGTETDEDPSMQLLAKNIKALKVEYRNGERFLNDRWDSSKRETRDLIPYMVKVTLEAWTIDLEQDERREEFHNATETISTILNLPYSAGMTELKQDGKAKI